ncbi:MAG: DnaB-like helicase N-terminal domain-containing protein [Planctomycetota bacterium]|jgi:replicative DNA helicase
MSNDSYSGRIPPHDLDAERAALGALMLAGDRIPDALELVGPEDFFDPRHRLLFEVLEAMSEASIPIEPVSINQALAAKDERGIVGGTDYLIEPRPTCCTMRGSWPSARPCGA